MDRLRRQVLASIPDAPRWVELRGALIEGTADVLGPGTDCVVVAGDGAAGHVLVVVGRPEGSLLRDVARLHPEAEVLVQAEARAYVEHLAGSVARRAVLHTLPGCLPPIAALETVLLEEGQSLPWDLPATLRAELCCALERVPVSSTRFGADLVSFCYPGAVTETLWDVAIETLAPFRRRGAAMSAFATMALHMERLGRRPVWCAEEGDGPSTALALRLGFRPAEEIFLMPAGAFP